MNGNGNDNGNGNGYGNDNDNNNNVTYSVAESSKNTVILRLSSVWLFIVSHIATAMLSICMIKRRAKTGVQGAWGLILSAYMIKYDQMINEV